MQVIYQNFKATVEDRVGNKVNINKFISSLSLSYALGSIYNTIRITLKEPNSFIKLGAKVNIEFDNITSTGYIVEVKEKPDNPIEILCKSIGVKLYKPFNSDINIVDNANDTNELLAKYSEITGVEIVSSLPTVGIDGAFYRGGEIGDAVSKIINLFNADVYEHNNKIFIEPKAPIDTKNTIVVKDIIDGSFSKTLSIQDSGIGKVVISDSSDVTIDSSIVADIFEDSGEVRLYTIASNMERLEGGSRGLTKPFINGSDEYIETKFLNNSNYIELQRYASEVIELKVNNYLVDFELLGKAIRFNENLRGFLTVKYRANYKKTYLIPRVVGVKKIGDFEVLVDDDYLSWVGEIVSNNDFGSLEYEVIGDKCSTKGFYIVFFSELPDIKIFKGKDLLDSSDKITFTENYSYDKTENIRLAKDSNNKFRATLRYKNATIKKVRIGGVETTDYTIEDNNGFIDIVFNDIYYKVEVLYTLNTTKVDIIYNETDFNIDSYLVLTYRDNVDIIDFNTQDCEGAIPCEYPATKTFNIAKILNVPLSEVVGKTITGLGTVDEFGEVKKTYNSDGIYTYDLSSIKPRAKLIFKANVNGSVGNDDNNQFQIG